MKLGPGSLWGCPGFWAFRVYLRVVSREPRHGTNGNCKVIDLRSSSPQQPASFPEMRDRKTCNSCGYLRGTCFFLSLVVLEVLPAQGLGSSRF